MSRLLSVLTILFFSSAVLVGQAPRPTTTAVSVTLIGRAQEWVDTWNNKDVERMGRLHADDASSHLYGRGDRFGTIEGTLKEIRRENFWNLSWSVKMVEPRVRILGPDAALVAVRLVGNEINSDGITRPYSSAYTLVFERQRNQWKIVHIHSSSGRAPGQD
jgi:uncharacterized protein (TIGR02246 family)